MAARGSCPRRSRVAPTSARRWLDVMQSIRWSFAPSTAITPHSQIVGMSRVAGDHRRSGLSSVNSNQSDRIWRGKGLSFELSLDPVGGKQAQSVACYWGACALRRNSRCTAQGRIIGAIPCVGKVVLPAYKTIKSVSVSDAAVHGADSSDRRAHALRIIL